MNFQSAKIKQEFSQFMVVFICVGTPAITGFIFSNALGAGPLAIYWALAPVAPGLGFYLWLFHPESSKVNWKKICCLGFFPAFSMPILLQMGCGVWSFGGAFLLHHLIKFYFSYQTKKGDGK